MANPEMVPCRIDIHVYEKNEKNDVRVCENLEFATIDNYIDIMI